MSYSGRDYVGEQICSSGAYNAPRYGGDLCGIPIQDADRCVNYYDDFGNLLLRPCGQTIAGVSGQIVGRTGDSGSPVYNPITNGLNVRGMFDGVLNAYDCPSGGQLCGNSFAYTQISHILSYHGVSLKKS